MKTRRDFIKISTLGALGMSMGVGPMSKLMATQKGGYASGASDILFKRFPTYCEVCFWKCAAWTYVNEEDRIVKVIGNEEDPHCDGRLCPRGTGGIGMYYDDDRLKTPLIRVTENGKQTYKKASWDEALDLVARKLNAVKDTYGAEHVALFNHGSSGKHFGSMLKAFGSSNITAPSYAQCRGPREVGFDATFGSSVGSPEPTDIRDTDCLVLIGSHIGENMHNGQVQEMSDAIDRGATIITVDPRFSTAAGKSKYWLPIKPSTDLALLLAWIHVLVFEDIYNKAYVEKYTQGLDKLKEHVRYMTPEWAYGITKIKPDQIRKTAYEMADAAPSVIVHPGRHVTWYGDDTQRSRAIAILNALLGSWGKRGGFYFPEKAKVPSYPHPAYPKPRWSWKNTLTGRYPFAKLAVSNAMIEASLEDAPDENRIRAWIVSGTNLPLTVPDKTQLEEAIQALDFIVVVDTMPMEITGYADVILPECTYLERYDDLRVSPHREPYIALRMPATEPLYDSKPASWMARELGLKLGLGAYYKYESFEEVLDWQLKQIGLSLEEMKQKGVMKFPKRSKLYIEDGADHKFKTPSGKIELYSSQLEKSGFDPIPVFTKHPDPPPNYYRLIYGRAPMHTFSRTANNQNLIDLMPENTVWVNPKVARLWRLKNGQKVWLKNQEGKVSSFPIAVRITERIRWDSVYMVHGFGHTDKKLSKAYGRGVSTNELMTTVMTDDIMGGTGMRGNFITFLLNKGQES